MARARATLAAGRGAAEFRDWPLGPNLGQCCGGMVRTLTETFDAADLAAVRRFEEMEQSGAFATASRLDANGRIVRALASRAAAETGRTAFSRTSFHERFGEATTPVLLFGAGHVGRAVVLALAPLPFTVRWIDGRQDQFPRHVPQNAVALCTRRPNSRTCTGTARRHGHRHDPFASARLRHHRRGAAAGRVRFRRPDRLGDQAGAVRELGPASGRRRKQDRLAGLSDRHAADQRQGTRRDCRGDRRSAPHRAREQASAPLVSPATQPA